MRAAVVGRKGQQRRVREEGLLRAMVLVAQAVAVAVALARWSGV